MVRRVIDDQRLVTNVVAAVETDVAGVALDAATKVMDANNAAKINEGISSVQVELNDLTQRYRLENQGDPVSNRRSFEQERQTIFDKYGESISPIYKNQWGSQTRKIKTQSDLSDTDWAFKQTQINTVASINNSIENNLGIAIQNGRDFASGDKTDVEGVVDFETSRASLEEFGAEHLGETKANELLSNYKDDYLKSTLAGVIEVSPDKAEDLLATDTFKENMTPDEIREFKKNISYRRKEIKLQSLGDTTKNEFEMSNAMEDPNLNYYEKRLNLDKAEANGSVSSTYATKQRRVLNSEKALDALTDNGTMAEFVTQIYDLNAAKDMDTEGYLIGIQNIQNKMLESRASGDLGVIDYGKMKSQMRTLTSNKLAEATQNIAYNFNNANEIFLQLPPEVRGEATRSMFYETHGKENLSPNDYTTIANRIVDDINKTRRERTLKSVDEILNTVKQSDTDLLQGLGYTMDDVRETASKHGITEAAVLDELRKK